MIKLKRLSVKDFIDYRFIDLSKRLIYKGKNLLETIKSSIKKISGAKTVRNMDHIFYLLSIFFSIETVK